MVCCWLLFVVGGVRFVVWSFGRLRFELRLRFVLCLRIVSCLLLDVRCVLFVVRC